MCRLRKCIADFGDGEKINCRFHCWEQHSDVIAPSPMRGGHGGGVVAQMYGLVEVEDTGKIWRCDPSMITFVKEDVQK